MLYFIVKSVAFYTRSIDVDNSILVFVLQELSAMQKALITDLSVFPLNGVDTYEEMVSRFAILSTGT